MIIRSRGFQLIIAFLLGLTVLSLPRPEGTRFRIKGDESRSFYESIRPYFVLVPAQETMDRIYFVETRHIENKKFRGIFLATKAAEHKPKRVEIEYVDGLSPKAMRFLAILAFLLFLFIFEPIP